MNNKNLSYGDYRELSQTITFKEYDANQIIYEHGDAPENFFILLKGSVNVIVRNEAIDHWDWANNVFQALL